MKFAPLTLFSTVLAVVSTSLAQNTVIGSPLQGASVSAGSNFTVRIDRPDTLSGSEEVAVVIGLWSCGNNPCPGPTNILGSILYNGPYKPQFSDPSDGLPPHENFTVAIPSGFTQGRAQLGVVHVALGGAGLAPFMQTMNSTVNIV
ncbi:hypothetical protein GYMLUDRAFT_172600 [Collybiopsis luxurians FD-317 M1]|uniref:Unplaced genomic scaffold GYMLUscaffold_42, whole genome shotgun sequence n=1 Tax=Collybiopsis luxurians FD-317 M1 TaxID=944289 RepID=A0A0D0BQX1_9AGAR|nr:hypothetical protein GYMLUDRAFT_172600 [Collybiopsis luxurians FD-317 M1]